MFILITLSYIFTISDNTCTKVTSIMLSSTIKAVSHTCNCIGLIKDCTNYQHTPLSINVQMLHSTFEGKGLFESSAFVYALMCCIDKCCVVDELLGIFNSLGSC